MICVSLCGSMVGGGSWFVRIVTESIVVEFFSYYFLYKLSDKSRVLGRLRR